MGIYHFQRGRFDRDFTGISVNEDDHIFGGFPLNFQGVESCKFQEGGEISAHIAVDHVVCQWGKGHYGGLAAARIGRDTTNWPVRDD